MAGGKSTPKKDKKLKVSGGALVKKGQIIVRGKDSYKAGINVDGKGTLRAMVDGKVSFVRKKVCRGSAKLFVNVTPA